MLRIQRESVMVDGDLTRVVDVLMSVRFNVTGESELQEAIERVLTEARIAHQREVRLTPKDRIDFMIGNIGLELKVDGSVNNIARQLIRYASCPDVGSLLLVTTRMRYSHAFHTSRTFNGKPLAVVRLTGGLF